MRLETIVFFFFFFGKNRTNEMVSFTSKQLYIVNNSNTHLLNLSFNTLNLSQFIGEIIFKSRVFFSSVSKIK